MKPIQSNVNMLKEKLKQREIWSAYLQIIIGSIIGGAAYPLFLTPNNIAPGGITGVAIILNYLLKLPVGTVSLILNIPLFLAGYHTMGKIFAFRSLLATVIFSLMIDILPFEPMTNDPLLSTLQFISTGTFLFAFDFIVVASAGLIMGTTEALYAMINIFISAKVIDAVMVGFSGNKACLIISPAWQQIMKRIMKEMDRGVTLLSAKGGYTGKDRPTLFCVISRQEIMMLKKIVQEEDCNSFMTIMEAHEAIGDGFSGLQQDNEG